MNRASLLALTVAVLSGYVHPATAQQSPRRARAGPPVPFADSGACPFEGCAYRAWTAARRVVVRRAPSAAAPVAFRIAAGDTVTALTGIVVTTVAGQVRFRDTVTLSARDTALHITPLDTLFLLTYEGEGFTTAWFKGRLYRGVEGLKAIFNAGCDEEPTSCVGRITVRVSATWWVKVCDSTGRIGWTDEPQAFAGKDALDQPERAGSASRPAPANDRCLTSAPSMARCARSYLIRSQVNAGVRRHHLSMTGKPPPLSQAQLESLCKILADTTHGLTGSEIERLLATVKVKDVDPANTKWKRLYNALATRQGRDQFSDRVFAFIRVALDPARYVGNHALFEDRRTAVNAVLALCGFEYRADGKFVVVNAAATLSEAEARAHRLRAALSARGVHPDVLASCRKELVQHNAFHAVLEASKSVAEKLRQQAGLQSDGAQLVDEALSGDPPKLRINDFLSDSEKSEQRGFTNLVKGLFGVFRNPTAHAPRVAWNMTDEDALDLFSLASYVHRRIDRAK